VRPWDKSWQPSIDEAREALNDECTSWIDYVLHAACCEHGFHNGVRDQGREGVTLEYFIKHANAIEAGLSPAHVVALRIYTTHLFKYLNGPLRDDSYGHEKKPHPLPITMSYLTEGIKKLRAVYVTQAKEEATSTVRLWRGMRNLDVGDKFLADRRGGTEVAPMSTTTDMSVAVHYGLSEGSLLFLLKVDNFMQYGADLQWLSAFPAEAEVLYPPLTYLQPTGRTQMVTVGDNNFKVVEVTPNIP